jgi:hypothetical protein
MLPKCTPVQPSQCSTDLNINKHRKRLGARIGTDHEDDIPIVLETIESLKRMGHSQGCYMIMYRLDDEGTYMYPVKYTERQFISDNFHDNNGSRPTGAEDQYLRDHTNVINSSCQRHFNTRNEHDDVKILNRLRAVIENDEYVLSIEGPDDLIKGTLHNIVSSSRNAGNLSKSVATPITPDTPSKPDTPFTIARKEHAAQLDKMEQTKDMSKIELEETDFGYIVAGQRQADKMSQRAGCVEPYILISAEDAVNTLMSDPIFVDEDQGFPSSIFTSSIVDRIFLPQSFDQGKQIMDLTEEEISINLSYTIGVFAFSHEDLCETMFIRPKMNGRIFSTTTQFHSIIPSSRSRSSSQVFNNLRASIGELAYLSFRGIITPIHAGIAKFTADRLCIISKMLEFDGALKPSCERYFATHDGRAFLDCYETQLCEDHGRIIYLEIPGIFSRITKYLDYTGIKTPVRTMIAKISSPRELTQEQVNMLNILRQKREKELLEGKKEEGKKKVIQELLNIAAKIGSERTSKITQDEAEAEVDIHMNSLNFFEEEITVNQREFLQIQKIKNYIGNTDIKQKLERFKIKIKEKKKEEEEMQIMKTLIESKKFSVKLTREQQRVINREKKRNIENL